MSSGRIRILGISDPLNAPTGFGRVARELFERLPRDRFELAYLSRGWVGTRRFDGVQTYSASTQDQVCAGAFPIAASDFGTPFLLWTLTDPWQTGWLSHEQNGLVTPQSRAWLAAHRREIRWIGHYPVDGEGFEGAPLWFEDFMRGPDVTVFMAEFGRKVLGQAIPGARLISHAVDVDRFRPQTTDGPLPGLEGRHLILAVMANRRRKYWPELLLAFARLKRSMPLAYLIGICGDPQGEADDTWSLADAVRRLKLETDVGFIRVTDERRLAQLYRLADLCVLLSGGEGFGLPQLEAHAAGKPCVVGAYSASVELAVHPAELVSPRGWTWTGNNLIKRPVYDPIDVATAMERLAANDRLRAEIGRRAEQQAQERAWDQILPQWIQLFEEQWSILTEGEASHAVAAEKEMARA